MFELLDVHEQLEMALKLNVDDCRKQRAVVMQAVALHLVMSVCVVAKNCM